MVRAKVEKIVLDDHGSYLGMEKGCFIVKDKYDNVERYPLFEQEIGEVILKSGNMVSTGALASLGFWDIDVLITTQKGKPVAMLKSLDDDSHVQTRLCQYEAVNNEKGAYIAKQFILGKFYGYNKVLEKYHLRPLSDKYVQMIMSIESEDKSTLQRKLMSIESKFTKQYFDQIFTLFPEAIRPEGRRTFKAYDGLNNLFNLGYEMLSWKVHRALINAKLEPYLGFLHSVQFGKPSLVCDLQELYRCLIDDFLIQHCQKLRKRDFEMKHEDFSKDRKGKREYLNGVQTSELMKKLSIYFESKVDVPRIKHGNRQTIETLINEEALLFAKYLRNERNTWMPRIVKNLL
jgi:CRISPR-associated protein Cas1